MTKRFKFNGRNNCIEYDGKSILLDSYGEDIEELLNELHEENESLKEENKFLRNKVSTYKSGNALLKKTLDKEWK